MCLIHLVQRKCSVNCVCFEPKYYNNNSISVLHACFGLLIDGKKVHFFSQQYKEKKINILWTLFAIHDCPMKTLFLVNDTWCQILYRMSYISRQWDRLAGNDSTLRNLHPQGNTIPHPALWTSQEPVHNLMNECENNLGISSKGAEGLSWKYGTGAGRCALTETVSLFRDTDCFHSPFVISSLQTQKMTTGIVAPVHCLSGSASVSETTVSGITENASAELGSLSI